MAEKDRGNIEIKIQYPIVVGATSCGCDGTIYYTSQQMYTNEQQTLQVIGESHHGCTEYEWVKTSGVGSLSGSSGLSVVYTAPAANPGCNNPVIVLKCKGNQVDTVTIAVTNYNPPSSHPNHRAWLSACDACVSDREYSEPYPWGWEPEDYNPDRCAYGNYTCCVYWRAGCDGVVWSQGACSGGCCQGGSDFGYTACVINQGWSCPNPGDNRTQAQIDGGCCPQQLV